MLLLGRSFYSLYVQKRGTRASKIVTWGSALVIAGMWIALLIRD